MNEISNIVIAKHTQQRYRDDSHGISIYYPKDPDAYNHTPFGGNYDKLLSSRNTHWDEFIKHENNGSGYDYTLTTTTFNWINTSSPTWITGDDQSVLISLPFTFTFYGRDYNRVYVCSNGFLSFTSRSTRYNPQEIPNTAEPNAIIAPLWRDLDPSEWGSITYYAGRDKFLVTYDVVNYRNYSLQTFQVILYPNGEIVFQYKKVTNDVPTTIGLENESGTHGKTAAFPANGTAYRWVPASKSTNSLQTHSILRLKKVTMHKDNIHLEFSEKPEHSVDVHIYNIAGQRIYKKIVKPQRSIDLNLNNLKSGIYIIFVKTGALKENRKIIITK